MKRGSLAVLVPVLLLALFVSMISYIWSIISNPGKAKDIAIGIDRVANRAFNGKVTETISSRAYRATLEKRSWGCILCKLLDTISTDHCKNSDGV